VGHDRSFVYDIADLYKAELTIPVAFELAALVPVEELSSAVRRRVRDDMASSHLLERMVHDIKWLLSEEEEPTQEEAEAVYLWDDRRGTVSNARNYGREEEDSE
jgi:CRISPR-associated protein Cas1